MGVGISFIIIIIIDYDIEQVSVHLGGEGRTGPSLSIKSPKDPITIV